MDLAKVTDWATKEFPEAFKTLPDVANLAVEPKGNRRFRLYLGVTWCTWPKESSSHLLYVGRFNVYPGSCFPSEGARVFAYVTLDSFRNSEPALKVRYVGIAPGTNYWVDISHHLQTMHWGAPFCAMTNGNPKEGQPLITALVCWYLLAKGHLHEIEHYRDFKSEFKMACIKMRDASRSQHTKPTHPQIAVAPQRNEQGSPKVAERHQRENSGADNAQEVPSSQLKRARRELDEACDLIEESNKRLKTEIEKLQEDKQQWEATRKRLEDDKWTLSKDLCRERETIKSLKKESKIRKEACTAMEKRAIQAEQKVMTCEAQLEKEKEITVRALGEKARLEIELQDLKPAQNA
ncbi:hypothetical protein SLS60_008493 [Paraconiothyrium brasiliense]|uniref:Uncharacterized protein n=1 Tax=Paraconiothyrium brasiliense TaxID=300254 RepID=A0ABR3R0S6_9PLEO